MKKVFLFLLIIVVGSPLLSQGDCRQLVKSVDDYISTLYEQRQAEPSREFYLNELERYRRYIRQIQTTSCRQSDSLIMELQLRFAVNICRPQGSLDLYKNLMDNSIGLMSYYVDSVTTELKKTGSSIDPIRPLQKQLKNMEDIVDDLKAEYADLTVLINRRFDEMTRVLSVDQYGAHPVQIHFRAPPDVYADDLKRRRLEFLSSSFDMILDSYDPDLGFYFKIPKVPLSVNVNSGPAETYAITFDRTIRFRLQNFNVNSQDTLLIEPLSTWKFVSNITDDYAKVHIPRNLDLLIYDKEDGRWITKLKESSEFIFVETDTGDALYLPVRNENTNSYDLVFRERKETSTWMIYGVRIVALLLFTGILGIAI